MDITKLTQDFDEWLKSHTDTNPLTRRNYVCGVRKLVDETDILEDVERGDIVGLRNTVSTWIFEKPRNYSRKYHVIHLLNFLGKRKYVEELKDIFKQIKIKDRRHDRYLSLAEWKKLINHIGELAKEEKDRRRQLREQGEDIKQYPPHIELVLPLLLQILYDTGARAELMKIKVRDVHEAEVSSLMYDLYGNPVKSKEEIEKELNYITFKTKGSKIFSRYIEQDTFEKIQVYMRRLDKEPNDYLFTDSKNMSPEHFRRLYYTYWTILKNLSRKLLDREYGISFHWTRTSRAKGLIRAGRNLVEVKTFLGHKDISTTMRYAEGGEFDSKKIIEDEHKWK